MLLRMDADVVTIDIVRRMLLDRRIELESNALLQFAKKTIGGPTVAQEEKLQAGALAMFSLRKTSRIAEKFGNPFNDGQNLVPAYECIQPCAEIRFC